MLLAIEAGMGHADDLLRDDPLMARMADADRRLTTTLVLGVLRWQILLDQEIRGFLFKPKAKFDAEVRIALRLGAFQLLHLDRIPAHAAIDESVELAKRSGYQSAAGLVNAVLRKIANAAQGQNQGQEPGSLAGSGIGNDSSHSEDRERESRPLTSSVTGNDSSRAGDRKSGSNSSTGSVTGHDFSRADVSGKFTGALAPEENSSRAIAAHPAWMVERWTSFFGKEAAAAICVHDQSPPVAAIRVASDDVYEELAAAGITLSPGHLLTRARLVDSGDLTGTAALRESRARLQDEGSQLVAEIAASCRPDSKKILDCCAAPGGKTLILGERNPPAHIVACETSRPRFKQLRDRLAALGEQVECRLADATALSFDSEFDLALADVPCSGTGTLGRNPEIRHRLQPEDLARQAERQRAILASALRAVRPGGCVVYSTCSLEPEENEEGVRAVAEEMENCSIVALEPTLRMLRDRGVLVEGTAEKLQRCLTKEGFLRLTPGVFGTDGFFIAMIEKGR